MLLNFCDPRLRPEIKCSTVSTEGYEVTNLTSDSCKGFLAYSCIKPPIHIDITFLCNIRINHILIWPSVGSQKSSGFQLYAKNTDDNYTPYTSVANGFLSPCDAGLLLYQGDIDPAKILAPENFLKRYIKVSLQYLTTYTHTLRLTICKTEKSVPALGKIEVWGTVSPRCGKDVVASTYALWTEHQAILASPVTEYKTDTTENTIENKQEDETTLEVPESFLDPITWQLMTQPIILPSGKVIDQTTLEKHGQNEAIWGRSLSDPFTSLPFSEHRIPVLASALKMRIDKFLLDNSNLNEVKKMPRVLGHNTASAVAGDRRIIQVPKCVLNKNLLKRTVEDAKLNMCKQTTDDSQQAKRHCHQLPAVIIHPKQSTANTNARSLKQTTKTSSSFKSACNNFHSHNGNDKSEILVADIDSSSDSNMKTLLSNIKRFSKSEKVELHNISSNCKCCDNNNNILYRLPCKHVICRKVLLSIENNECKSCGLFYKSSDVERIHNNILST